ncbi:MAG: sarcosine oxidase subunit gamma family protein [Pseudomonadota bacterium]
MSNAVSPLQGASYDGFARMEEQGLRGMITVRGDLADAGFTKAIKSLTGCAVPEVRRCEAKGDFAVAWMSPDELLILCPYDAAEPGVAQIAEDLAGSHHLVVNMSDARAVFRVSGEKAAQVIAKLAPIDISPDAFGIGDFRRTRLAQTPAAFWMPEPGVIELICFRSVAEYALAVLSRAAMPGSEVW